MILADTSIWIDHFRRHNDEFGRLLVEGHIVMHHDVIGELACGTLPRRAEVLALLKGLPPIAPARHEEVLALIEKRQLAGKGLGWIDMHLLAAALLAGCQLWTRDARLRAAAESITQTPFARS